MDGTGKEEGTTETDGRDPGVAAGVLLAAFLVLFVGIGPGNVAVFVDPPAAAIVLGLTLAGWLVAYGVRGCRIVLRGLFARGATGDERCHAADACGLGARMGLLSGVLGTLIGLVLMLAEGMDDPRQLTMGCAVALLTHLYGLILAGVCLILRARLRWRSMPTSRDGDSQDPARLQKGMTDALLLLSFVWTGVFAFSPGAIVFAATSF